MNYLRSCLQDAILNCAMQLGVDINKKELYRQLPPDEHKNTDLSRAINAPAVKYSLKFTKMNFDRIKGGMEYNLLRAVDCGVYLCLAEVQDYVYGERKTEKHSFVYNSHYRNQNTPWTVGAVIDNRAHQPIYLIEEEDRSTKDKARKVFEDFFNAPTKIYLTYLVEENSVAKHVNKKQKVN